MGLSLARDMERIFVSTWNLAAYVRMTRWENIDVDDLPDEVKAGSEYNQKNPLKIQHAGQDAHVYITVGSIYPENSGQCDYPSQNTPRPFNGPGRVWDLDTVLGTINEAQEFIYIQVRDVFPMMNVYSDNPT